MASSDITESGDTGQASGFARSRATVARGAGRIWKGVARYLPKRLYARSLIIVIAPMLLLQSVIAFVFMERHWQTVTLRLSAADPRDSAALSDTSEP